MGFDIWCMELLEECLYTHYVYITICILTLFYDYNYYGSFRKTYNASYVNLHDLTSGCKRISLLTVTMF